MKIISEAKHIDRTDYQMVFYRIDPKNPRSGCAYSFECNSNGVLDPIKHEAGRLNYEKCLKGFDPISGEKIKPGVLVERDSSYFQCAIGKCDCGCKVALWNFTNTCDCGIDYNSSGQKLAPRSQWGQETGEHWSECY